MMTQNEMGNGYVWSDNNNETYEYPLSPSFNGNSVIAGGVTPAFTPTLSDNSMTPPLTAAKPQRERRQIERKVVYPYFLNCLEYTDDDPYWQQVLNDCARGKFPRGSSFDAANKTICIRITKTPVFYKVSLESVSPADTFMDIKRLFKTHLNLNSSEDKRQMNLVHDDLKEKTEARYSKSWKDINIKKVKSAIIRNYIIAKGDELGLSKDEKIEFYKLVKVGLLFGWISKGHIVYKDRQIESITSLKYFPTERVFKIDGMDDQEVSASIVKYKPKVSRMDNVWRLLHA